MTKRLARHPGNLVFLAVRAWFLEAVREWCPEVLEDLWRAVYVPLEARVGRDDAARLLRSSLPVDREVETGILRWARRWRLDTVWIRDEAWRTLRFWAAHPRDARGKDDRLRWAPLINTRPLAVAPPVRRPRVCRNGAVLEWLVRLRVCRPAVAARELVAEYHVDLDTIRVGQRVFGIACGHPDGNDADHLADDPRSTASRNRSTFPCAPAAAPGPHRVEATPPKHVHILGRGIRCML